MSKFCWIVIAVCLLATPIHAQEETVAPNTEAGTEGTSVGFGGFVDVAHAVGRKAGNANTLGDNNFNNMRTLLMFNAQQGSKIRADVEVLFDDRSKDRIRLQGAFVTIFDVPNEAVNFMIGKIPNPFGNFAKREFSDINPLIGQPLMRQYRTALDWNNLWNNAEQIARKSERKKYDGNIPISRFEAATPTVYDARWDFGVQMFGTIGWFEYQAAVTEGSISNPEADLNKGKQFVGRIGFNPVPGIRIGFSGAYNPYLSKADDQRLLEEGKGLGEYHQTAYGADWELSYRYFMMSGEFVRSTWDATVIEGELSNWSVYSDIKYKLHPRWYIAGRYDIMRFSEIRESKLSSKKTPWDYNVQRYEAGIGFRVTTDVTLKLVEQWTRFDQSEIPMSRLTAVQLSVPF